MALARAASTNQLIQEGTDIDLYPSKRDANPEVILNKQFTLGDLHGNALKFIHFLVREGIMEISQQDYQKIVSLYYKNSYKLSKQDLADFSGILARAKINPHANSILIRLLGDEWADRGRNDALIVLILEALRNHGIPYEILASNHGLEGITHYERGNLYVDKDEDEPGPQDECKKLPAIWIKSESTGSINSLYGIMQKKAMTYDRLESLIEDCYKPFLKALSYTLSEDESQITLYTHAGIGIENIQYLADKVGVTFDDTSPAALGKTIDAINTAMRPYIEGNKLHILFNTMAVFKEKPIADPVKDPFAFLGWNRNYDEIQRPSRHPKYGYAIYYVHGHSDGPTNDFISNMNNELGQRIAGHRGPIHENNEGIYIVLISQDKIRPDIVLKPLAKPQQSAVNDAKQDGLLRPKPRKRYPANGLGMYSVPILQNEENSDVALKLLTKGSVIPIQGQ